MVHSKTESYKGCEIETRVRKVGDIYLGSFKIRLLPAATEVYRLGEGLHITRGAAHADSARMARQMVDAIRGDPSTPAVPTHLHHPTANPLH